MDEADMAQRQVDAFLAASLLRQQSSGTLAEDKEAVICGDCDYRSPASHGKTCEAWRECLADHDKAAQAKRRNGTI